MFSVKFLIIRVSALILALILSPVLLITGLGVFLSTKEFPIFTQKRALTFEDRKFIIYKFRTIRKHKVLNSAGTFLYKPELERYVPRFGSFLRKTGFDEILQLINIIKGDMSFIGPRPLSFEDIKEIKKDYPELYYMRAKINIKPGITGFWQVLGKRECGIENLVKSEMYYLQNRSLKLNMKILGLTFKTILTRTHSDSIIINKNIYKKEEINREGISLIPPLKNN